MLSYAPIEEGSEGIIGFAIAAFLCVWLARLLCEPYSNGHWCNELPRGKPRGIKCAQLVK